MDATGKQSDLSPIQPMFLRQSLLFFGVPAVALVVGFHLGMPALIREGLAPFYAYAVGVGSPLVLMLLAALVAYRLEGNAFVWHVLRDRFRLYGLGGRAWLWVVGTFIVMLLGYGAISALTRFLVDGGFIPLPDGLPAFLDPRAVVPQADALDRALGGSPLWLGFLTYLALLAVNILGEELWWRSYVLPRQELAFAKWTWVVHGLLWGFFHLFKWWDVVGLLAVTLPFAFTVVRLRNTTAGIAMHALFNGIGVIPILLFVMNE